MPALRRIPAFVPAFPQHLRSPQGNLNPDTTPPVITVLTGPTLTKVSDQSTKDSSDFTWQANEDLFAYEIRIVPSAPQPYSPNYALVESGGAVTAGQTVSTNITSTELETALGGSVDGSYSLQVYGLDLAGNWSS